MKIRNKLLIANTKLEQNCCNSSFWWRQECSSIHGESLSEQNRRNEDRHNSTWWYVLQKIRIHKRFLEGIIFLIQASNDNTKEESDTLTCDPKMQFSCSHGSCKVKKRNKQEDWRQYSLIKKKQSGLATTQRWWKMTNALGTKWLPHRYSIKQRQNDLNNSTFNRLRTIILWDLRISTLFCTNRFLISRWISSLSDAKLSIMLPR